MLSRKMMAAMMAALSLGALGVASAQASSGPTVYNSGDSSEMIEWLPVHFTGSVTKYTLFCIDLGTAPVAGEVLSVDADFEITDDLPYTLLVSSQVLLAGSCSATTGIEITEGNGTNMNVDIRHAATHRSGSIEVPFSSGNQYVVLSAWSMSGSGQWQSGDVLRVEQDYGRMSVLRWP